MKTALRVTLALLLLSDCAPAGQPPGDLGAEGENSPAFELSPGVVVDPDPSIVYLMRPESGIEAVDSASGKTIWRTTEIAKPLTVVGRRLVVQTQTARRAELLPIALLDVKDGSMTAETLEIPLPPGVRALITQELGESFSARGWLESGDLIIAWTYLRQDVTGMAPPPGAAPFAARDEGAVRVDLDSGRVERLSVHATTKEPILPPKVQDLVDSGELRKAPWRIGGVLAATVDQTTDSGSRRVALRRWDAATGAPREDILLFEGSPLAQLPSADHRHLLIVSLAAASSDAWDRYQWSIFSLASGELVGEFRYHQSANRFSVLGTILLHLAQPYGRRVEGKWVEQALKLEAFDLRRGIDLWSRALRDTVYRGPQPPSS